MIAGDTINRLISLQYATGPFAGSPIVCPDVATFTGLGFALTWYDNTVTALASQPSYTVTCVDTARGVHVVSYALPTGKGVVLPTIPSTAYRIDPYGWSFDGLLYDENSIGAYLQTAQGTPGVLTLTDNSLGDVVDGASFQSGAQVCPLLAFSRFGLAYSDVANNTNWPLTIGIKDKNGDTAITLAATRGAGFSTDGTISFGWDAWPSSTMSLNASADERTKTWYVDVEFRKAASPNTLIVPLRFSFNVVWRRYAT